ncbi:MAG: hypothetical protein RIC53_08170 [Cyclobacteriaceae bacterium]
MRKCYLLIFLIGFLIMACGDQTASSPEGGETVPVTMDLENYDDGTGISRAYRMGTDNLSEEGSVLDGKKHGSWVAYNDDGSIASITTYHVGVKEGVAVTFDKQGYAEVKSFYHNDMLNGNYLVFKRKRVIESRNYRDGELEGIVRKYYENGEIMEEAPYKEGNLDGIAKWYDQEGNLSIAYEYHDGELVNKEAEVD